MYVCGTQKVHAQCPQQTSSGAGGGALKYLSVCRSIHMSKSLLSYPKFHDVFSMTANSFPFHSIRMHLLLLHLIAERKQLVVVVAAGTKHCCRECRGCRCDGCSVECMLSRSACRFIKPHSSCGGVCRC